MVMVVVSMVMSIGASSLVTDNSFGFSLSSISEKKGFFHKVLIQLFLTVPSVLYRGVV